MNQDLKKKIFYRVVELHTQTGKPVGSKILTRRYFKTISPASMRCYLSELVDEGLLQNVNISTGRIPTDKGWRQYVRDMQEQQGGHSALKRKLSEDTMFKILLPEMHSTVIVRGGAHERTEGLFDTLLSPEFEDRESLIDFLQFFEDVKKSLDKIAKNFSEDESHVFIGDENPINSKYSMMIMKKGDALCAIIGPKRMDYPKNIQFMQHISELL